MQKFTRSFISNQKYVELRNRAPEKTIRRYVTTLLKTDLSFSYCKLQQCTELARNPPDGVSVGLGEDDNIFVWDLMIIGPPDTLYEGGFFNAKLEFPNDFPNAPPVMTFKTSIWHPNGTFYMPQLCSNFPFVADLLLSREVCLQRLTLDVVYNLFLQCMRMEKCVFRSYILLAKTASTKE